ncbi:MAG: methyltransferase domain-containing protein [Opitutaceae bacterium]|nr:methyltransferase domain-containing protein [Opitutaceae bacterium]MBP9911792.1 methyltransferase domain-containing protein [Opitutaceae bacterium]
MNYVQYGCGHQAPASWRNFDSSPTLVLERFPILGRVYSKNSARFPANVVRASIVKGLPVAPSSADAVYCSHTLEHLALDEFRAALCHTFAMLKPGGVFRFVLPDLEFMIQEYVKDPRPLAAHTFMDQSMLGVPVRSRGLAGFLKGWLGGSAHLWMWDYKAMAHELTAAGFTDIRRAAYGDAVDRMFDAVETIDRWTNCLGVQCRRPPAR